MGSHVPTNPHTKCYPIERATWVSSHSSSSRTPGSRLAMAHALAAPRPVATAVPCPARRRHPSSPHAVRLDGPPPPPAERQQQQHGASINAAATLHQRRTLICGLVAAGLGSAVHAGEANAAARRPPPPPPTEKKDPNVSGVQAKVLASKKRKEAMKAAMAELRERGKPVVEEPRSETPQ
ncbi:hypothetical protein Taro_008571 [Colocasia esculenta]|uniref:Uncharacterized protein n=1 Tax=Colocasia esculenta TaxID=4460 RepID=A0A843U3D1_COLES|nr:hypothetical protein [Colocasia esculenta]